MYMQRARILLSNGTAQRSLVLPYMQSADFRFIVYKRAQSYMYKGRESREINSRDATVQLFHIFKTKYREVLHMADGC